MRVVHRVTGYDKATEFIAYEFDVPDELVPELRRLAEVDPEAREVVGAYPLDRTAAWAAGERLRLPLDLDRCDWFFEPFAVF